MLKKIVLTGGPCAGKSSAMSALSDVLSEHGYKVLIVPETATELILSGVVPCDEISRDEFENLVYDEQAAKEDIYECAAKNFVDAGRRVVILYDRAIPDNKAFMSESGYREMLQSHGTDEARVYARYDAVIHLTSAAKGAEEYYVYNDPASNDVGNNVARSETLEEARLNDDKNMSAWQGHPCFRVIDNSTDFPGKIQRVIDEIFAILAESEQNI